MTDAIQIVPNATGPAVAQSPKRDLSEIVGDWVEDPAFDEAISAQEVVDPKYWS